MNGIFLNFTLDMMESRGLGGRQKLPKVMSPSASDISVLFLLTSKMLALERLWM